MLSGPLRCMRIPYPAVRLPVKRGYGILPVMPREQNYPAKINARVTWETWRALEWLAAGRDVPVGVIVREALELAVEATGGGAE